MYRPVLRLVTSAQCSFVVVEGCSEWSGCEDRDAAWCAGRACFCVVAAHSSTIPEELRTLATRCSRPPSMEWCGCNGCKDAGETRISKQFSHDHQSEYWNSTKRHRANVMSKQSLIRPEVTTANAGLVRPPGQANVKAELSCRYVYRGLIPLYIGLQLYFTNLVVTDRE